MPKNIFPLLMILCVILFSFSIKAQIPNSNFEKWNKDAPAGWWSNNKPVLHFSPVEKTTEAHGGRFAVKGTVTPMGGTMSFAPVIHTGNTKDSKFSISKKYSGIAGYYKFKSVKKDQFVASVFMFDGSKQIGKGIKYFQSAGKYSRFEVKINYTSDKVPDKCKILFTVFPGYGGKDQLTVHKGSVVYLDDLTFIK